MLPAPPVSRRDIVSEIASHGYGVSVPALTGARGPAALAVVAYHLALDPTVDNTTSWLGLETLFGRGDLGVDFFFLLSGFIIHHVYRNVFAQRLTSADVKRFVLYRFARLWPLHMVTMLGALLLYAAAVLLFNRMPADAASYEATSILANALMVQSWLGLGSPNVPAWSISAEWAAYLAFPGLCWLMMRLPLFAWLVLGTWAWLLTGTEFVTHPLGRITSGFLIGIILRECEGRFRLAHRLSHSTGTLVLTALIAGCWLLPNTALLPYTLGFTVLILALCNPADWLARFAATKPLVYLGEISFALYLVHAVIWSAFKNLWRIMVPGIEPTAHLPVLAGASLSLLAAGMLYHFIELPGREFLRRGRRRTQRPASGSGLTPADAQAIR